MTKQINNSDKKPLLKASTIIVFFVIGVIFYLYFKEDVVPYFNESNLKKNGIRTSAILIKSEKVGFLVEGSEPKMKITFKITSKDGKSWEAETEKVIPFSQLYSLAPGTVFNVIYDPKDRNKVIISD